jgi:O-acetyl-ADP-ribose deacetylase (regulator of RNase III)
MENETSPRVVEFGRTRIAVGAGEPVDQPVQAIICPANARGIMPSSGSHSLRFSAGPDVERQVRALTPLNIGTAVITSSGNLDARGIERLIHAIITSEPGAGALLPNVRDAVAASLELAQRERIRSLAIPILGMEADASPEKRTLWIEGLVDEVVAHVRRDRSSLDEVMLVSRYPDDEAIVAAALTQARARSWRS